MKFATLTATKTVGNGLYNNGVNFKSRLTVSFGWKERKEKC